MPVQKNKILFALFRIMLKMSLLNDVLACSACSRTWRARLPYELGVLHKMACLACFKKWRAWRALKTDVLGLLHKMACLTYSAYFKLMKCFLDVFAHGTLVNCEFFWIKINNSWYITLFVVSGSIRKLFSIDFVNIYLYSIFLSIDFEIKK